MCQRAQRGWRYADVFDPLATITSWIGDRRWSIVTGALGGPPGPAGHVKAKTKRKEAPRKGSFALCSCAGPVTNHPRPTSSHVLKCSGRDGGPPVCATRPEGGSPL